ncbi:MAG: hypothetical protein LCH81_21950 [Bacteroidetes bacterium]|nr:hypothetical protein [Bacteroidota bacterium]
MKTIEQRDTMIHNCFMIGMLAFFTCLWCAMDHEALSTLIQSMQNAWVNFGEWTSSGMMSPHKI